MEHEGRSGGQLESRSSLQSDSVGIFTMFTESTRNFGWNDIIWKIDNFISDHIRDSESGVSVKEYL